MPPEAALGRAVRPISATALRSAARLRRRRGREASGLFLAEGPQAVREALGRPGDVELLVVADPERHASLIAGSQAPVRIADPDALASLCDTVNPQGIVAVCRQRHASWDALDQPRLVVVCAQVRDPGNAGTVIRCADAFGADAVVLSAGSVELHNPKVVRASVGGLFHLPILTGADLADAAARLRAFGMRLLAADASGEALDAVADRGILDGPVAWILGNEAWGLPDDGVADQRVAVPMWGRAESLNLASAAAVCLYQTASAQRRRGAGPAAA